MAETSSASRVQDHPGATAAADPGSTPRSGTRRMPKAPRKPAPRGSLRYEIVRISRRITPSWRGWIHLGAFPLAVIGGLALVIVSPTIVSRLAAAIFALTGMMLFGTSAAYHRARWPKAIRTLLRRADYSNIFLIIAGTYTPLAVLTLPHKQCAILLTIMWSGAIIGVAFRLLWASAPRWLFVPVYVGIGLAGVGFVPAIWQQNPTVGILVVAGGACYIAGALIYGIKAPNPVPNVFGFHEIFHALTVLGYGCHLAALLCAAVAAGPIVS